MWALLALSVVASSVHAVVFQAPRATSVLENGDLLTPPKPTLAAVASPELLLKRDFTALLAPDNTCGYFSGLAGANYFCNPTSLSCVFFSTSFGYGHLACCGTAFCAMRTTCVDYFQYASGSCDNGCQKDTFTLKCTYSSYPYCNMIRFPKESIEDYFCDSSTVSSYQLAYTTYDGERDGRTFKPVNLDISSSTTSSSSSSTSTRGSSPTPTSSSSSPTTPTPIVGPAVPTSPSPASDSTSTPVPVAPIVGGVVGGFAFLAAVGVAIFFILRRNRNKGNAAGGPTAQDPTMKHYPPQPQGTSQQPTAFAPLPVLNQTTQQPPEQGFYQQAQTNQATQQSLQEFYQPAKTDQAAQQFAPGFLAQQAPHPGVPELQEGQLYGNQPVQQRWSSAPGPSPDPSFARPAGMPPTPSSQTHLSAIYHEVQGGSSPTMSHSQRDSSFAASTPNSPIPTYQPYRPPQNGATEMSSEASPNMSAGPFPRDLHHGTYEVPGSEAYTPQSSG